MPIAPSLLLLLGGVIIVLGIVVNYLFRKTGLSDVIFLLLFGLALGSYFKVIDPNLLILLAPIFSPIALLIILIDGGLSINLYDALKGSFRATILAILGSLFSMLAVTAISSFLFEWRLIYCLLLGAIAGPTGSVVVISMVNKLKLDSTVATILKLETTMNDVIAIVIILALLDSMVLGEITVLSVVRDIIEKFAVGGMVGLISGILWYFALEKLRGQQFSYMLTIAVAFIIFGAVESMGGSGLVSVLFLGLALGNEENLAYILRREKKSITFDSTMRSFHAEISFFIQTFFFVYLGLIVSISHSMNVIYGILISIALVVARFAAVELCTIRSTLKKNRGLLTLMLPKGLSTAVMAVLVISYASQYPERISVAIAQVISDLTFVVIIATIIICTAGSSWYAKKEAKEIRAGDG